MSTVGGEQWKIFPVPFFFPWSKPNTLFIFMFVLSLMNLTKNPPTASVAHNYKFLYHLTNTKDIAKLLTLKYFFSLLIN